MSSPYIGEIRMFGGTFAPAGWANCDGQLMPISENDALFILIGTTYGGDGQETFALPNLQSRLPLHMGNSFQLGESAGTETVTLTTNQIPQHTHPLTCNDTLNSGNAPTPSNNFPANQSSTGIYADAFNPQVAMAPNMLAFTGVSQPHENMQPFLVVTFIISLFGIFPSPT